MTARHNLKLQIPPVDRKDKANKLQLSFHATVLATIPHRNLVTQDHLWKKLLVEVEPSFHVSIKLLWKEEPSTDQLGGISETLGKKLAKAEFWEQLSLKPSLSIPSVDEIVLHLKSTVALPAPPPHVPTSRLRHISLVYSWKPNAKRKGGGLRVEELLPLTNLALKSLLRNALGKDGVTGGVFLPGYAAEMSERQKQWDRIASSILSVADKDGGSNLRTLVNDLKTQHRPIDIRTLLKSEFHRVTSMYLRSKPQKHIQGFADSEGLETADNDDGVFLDLIAEDETNTAGGFHSTTPRDADDWLLEDADDSWSSSLDHETIDEDIIHGNLPDDGEERSQFQLSAVGESTPWLDSRRTALHDQQSQDILEDDDNNEQQSSFFDHDLADDSDRGSVQSLLDDGSDLILDHDGADSMLDDSDTQSLLSDPPSPVSLAQSPLVLRDDMSSLEKVAADVLLHHRVGDDMLLEDDVDTDWMIDI